MRTLISFLIFFLFVSFSKPNRTYSNSIKIVITGVEEVKGNIRIGIFNSSKGFPVTGNQFKGFEYKVTGKKMTLEIPNIPKGNYAIGVLHDLNKNGIMDKNILGYPTEVYGFSNNARATFSAPTFESAKFYHDGSTTLNIALY